ncbi:MAG: tetratricopeptide repeat-containing glycosyltransferase family protein [Desulfuromonadaceae bacterium]|nr:tetratricopeptide repeat-containing glycosyltransferase family protein [Desulfuromonadaceae bacterium]
MNNLASQLQKLFSEGSALLHAGNAVQALDCFQRALIIDPLNPTLYLYAGASLHELKKFDEAVTSYEKAIQMAPTIGEAHNNLGNSLMALGRFSDAADSFSRAVTLLPLSPVPLTAKATALQAMGKTAESEADCHKALKLDPLFAAAHWNLALNLLLQGKYTEGWQEYEWRWKKPDFTSPCRHNDVPLWNGSPLHGRTILLHAEQGFGDAIQFVRYSPMVAQRGGAVIVECHPELVQLLLSVEGVQDVVPFGAPLPPFDCQAPLLSLPRIFETKLQTIPSHCPYISVSNIYREKWAALVSPCLSSIRVGLVWAGKKYPDPLRSCRLVDLAPLATARNITFYSLQLGVGSEETKSPPPGMELVDQTSQIHDFGDTAALIERLDLIISIDTAVSHLAGALGKPVLLLLPLAPDWRWLLERSDSPWYPSMKIFRQKQSGDWGEVIARLLPTLTEFIGRKRKSFEGAPKE